MLCSRRGVEVVRREIEAGYDRQMVDLEEDLLPVLEMLHIEWPETESWRKRLEENRRARAKRRLEWDEISSTLAALHGPDVDPLECSGARPVAEPQAVSTYRRHDARVGRNAPCPCGSGRKYKKCCGRQ
ncbi:MAG: hypothetical protein GY778_27150 [bacterium]|nr:hypothetical protein [bacterium]